MQICSYIKIQNLNQVDSLSGNSLIMTGNADEAYISKTIAYENLSTQLLTEISSVIFNQLWNNMSAAIENEYHIISSQMSAQISKNTLDISKVSSDLSDYAEQFDLLEKSVDNNIYNIQDLSSFAHGIVVSSILKIANCQLSVRRDLDDFKTGLSVEVV